MTEEQSERLIKVLEKLTLLLELRGVPLVQQTWTINPGQCLICGCYHNGLQCPTIKPMSTTC